MLKVILVVVIGLFNLPKTTPCISAWSQCGGQNWSGETCCVDGYKCTYSDAYYSQCRPSSTSSTTGCGAAWDQCGGQNWSGVTCCSSGLTCTYSNPWYSQCLLTTSSSSSPSSTDSTSTTTQSTSSTSSSAQQASVSSGVWGQCAGIGWTGPIACASGSTCTYSNPWYSQCLPTTSSSSSSSSAGSTSTPSTTQQSSSTSSSTTIASTSSSSTSSSNPGCTAVWQQCGGIGWTGSTTCCDASTTCNQLNAWYFQCVPSAGASTSSSTTVSSGTNNGVAGVTTRYWDCCKPSCAWSGKASVTNTVLTCAVDGSTPLNNSVTSGCDSGGSAYTCSNQQPWSVNSTFSFGYAAVNIAGGNEASWCCACYLLTFTSGPVAGQQMIVQATNTGGDLGSNHFDLQMPGGGVGIFDGCTSQFGSSSSWGAQYGGVSQRSDCAKLPAVLQAGCYWRFDWFKGADNPTVSFEEVPCPTDLTDKTKCIRN